MPGTEAVVCHGPGDVRISGTEASEPGPGEIVLEPLAVGVCGTDGHIVAGQFPLAEYPVTLGHEVCGRVISLGPSVDGVSVGDLVTVEPHHYCTECSYCRLGQEHLCDHKRGYGVRLPGGMAHRMTVPARIAYRLPEGTPPWIGALTEPLACCVHGMDRLDPTSGLPVLIYGAGPAGAMMVALAVHRGLAPIVVIDPREERRELALRMGAHEVYASDSSVSPGTFPHVIDAVGSSAVLESAVRMASRGGRILVFGVARPDDEARIKPAELFSRELTLLGAVINPYTHHRAVGLLPVLGLDRFRPAFFDLHDVSGALTAQHDGVTDKAFIAPYGAAAALTPSSLRRTSSPHR